MYQPMFLYVMCGFFLFFFSVSIMKKGMIGVISGIINIFTTLMIITQEYGTRYVSSKETINNVTEIAYETNVIDIPEILIVPLIAMIVLQLLISIDVREINTPNIDNRV